MKQFIIYILLISVLCFVFNLGGSALFPNKIQMAYPFSFISITLVLIFVSKYWFLRLTKRIQDSKSDFWVNANLLAFAVKFILIITLLVFLALFINNDSKEVIIWTSVLYSFLLLGDILFYTLRPQNK